MRYLLVTHIPFARQSGAILLDRLWAEDLKGLTASIGPVTVAAPEILDPAQLQGWGAGFARLEGNHRLTFLSLPIRRNRLDLLHTARLRSVLRKAVDRADLIHTSNLFDPNCNLYFAHDYASRRHKKTLFVVAEDFYDMLGWEWVRTAPRPTQRVQRQAVLNRLDRRVRARVATASLTFLHTPAAVARYRSFANNAIAIRQPVHEREDVIPAPTLAARNAELLTGATLHLVTASRMQPLKGNDMLLRALAILRQRGITVRATLYGAGPELEPLRTLAKRLAIADLVILPGALTPAAALRPALEQGHLFLMPHLTSDFGRAFFDALAAALPVIAFRSLASQDTIRDGIDGLLAANADPEALANAIALYHHDRPRLTRAAEAARIRALDNTRTFWNTFRASLIRELFPPEPAP